MGRFPERGNDFAADPLSSLESSEAIRRRQAYGFDKRLNTNSPNLGATLLAIATSYNSRVTQKLRRTRAVRAAALLAILFPALLLGLIRALQIRSAAHQLYAGEAAGLGRLGWELSQGSFEWLGGSRFVSEYTNMYYEQGTIGLQVVALAFAPLFGHSLAAQWAAAALLESLAVLALTALLMRLTSSRLALLGSLVLVLPASFVLSFALFPYGSHTEYLWVPLGVAWWLGSRDLDERSVYWGTALGLFLAGGLWLYRFNGLTALVLFCVVVCSRSRRRWMLAGLMTLVAILAGRAMFEPFGMTFFGMYANPDESIQGIFPGDAVALNHLAESLTIAWTSGLPAHETLGLSGALHKTLMLGSVLLAGFSWFSAPPESDRARRRHQVARFASLWAALALAAPVLTGSLLPSYFIQGYVAAHLCFVLGLASPKPWIRRLVACVLLVLAVQGGRQAVGYIDLSTWDQELPDYDLRFVLDVRSLDADELPYYRRIIREGRGSHWIGLSSYFPSRLCLRWAGTRGEAPRPSNDHCQGWEHTELGALVADVTSRTVGSRDRDAAFNEIGRGVWIRSNRDMDAVRRATREFPPEASVPILRGATDEERRWR